MNDWDWVNRRAWRDEQGRYLERNCIKALQEGGEKRCGQISPLSQKLTSLSQLAHRGPHNGAILWKKHTADRSDSSNMEAATGGPSGASTNVRHD